MSKYRICFRRSWHLWLWWLAGAGLLTAVLFSIQDHSPIAATEVKALLALLFALLYWRYRPVASSWIASVSEAGDWLWLSPDLPDGTSTWRGVKEWRISPSSRAGLGLLWVRLVPKMGGCNGVWLWIFTTDIPTQDYRRLARIIRHQQQRVSD